MIVFVAWLLVQNTAQAPSRDPRVTATSGSAILRGVVVDEPTGAPIAGARVNVTSRSPVPQPWSSPAFAAETTASEDGRFEFTDLPAGEFLVSANPGEFRASHLPKILGHDNAGTFLAGSSLELTAGEVRSNVRIALPRAAAIEGRVVNEYGEPMSDVTVKATDEARASWVRQSATDDRGRFRIYSLEPGRYRVCAGPEDGWSIPRAAHGDGFEARYTRMCTPSPVPATVGETPAVQIQLYRVGAFTLSGTIVSSTGADISNARVRVERIGPDGDRSSVQSDTRDGHFVARGLVPGEYALFATVNASNAAKRDEVRESALMSVRLDGADVTDLAITTVPAASVNGRVERDARARGPLPSSVIPRMSPPVDRLRLVFTPPPSTTVNTDGTFTIREILGPQVVTVSGLPDGWFVSAVRRGDDDITDQPHEFRAGDERPLTIVLSDRSATLRARPVGENGTFRSDAYVMLLPADPRRWRAMPFSNLPARDKDGFFRMGSRAPGEYLVVALPAQDVFRLPRVTGTLEPIARAGTRITLVEGETLTLDVPVRAIEDRR